MNLGLVYGSISDQDSKICHVGSEKDCWKTRYTPHLQMHALMETQCKHNASRFSLALSLEGGSISSQHVWSSPSWCAVGMAGAGSWKKSQMAMTRRSSNYLLYLGVPLLMFLGTMVILFYQVHVLLFSKFKRGSNVIYTWLVSHLEI